jgi:acyl carrier protein
MPIMPTMTAITPMTPSASDAVAAAICTAIRTVLRDTGRAAGAIKPAMLLAADLGLDSLDLAQTIVLLERSLGIDPFRTPPAGSARPAIRTVADLESFYSQGLSDRPEQQRP